MAPAISLSPKAPNLPSQFYTQSYSINTGQRVGEQMSGCDFSWASQVMVPLLKDFYNSHAGAQLLISCVFRRNRRNAGVFGSQWKETFPNCRGLMKITEL